MRKNQVRLATLVVASLAAIGPSITSVRADKARRPRPIGQVISVQRISPLSQRRIQIQLSPGGNSYWGEDSTNTVLAQLRNRLVASGIGQVAIVGMTIEDSAQTMDYVHGSGRYSVGSRRQVRRGQWVAPTDKWYVQLRISIGPQENGFRLNIGGQDYGYQMEKLVARVELVIETVDLRTGLHQRGIHAVGTANRKTRLAASGFSNFDSAGFDGGSNVNENRLMAEATDKALDQVFARLRLEPLE